MRYVTAVAIMFALCAGAALGIKCAVEGKAFLKRLVCKHAWQHRYEERYCPKCDWHRWH
jgi:hypothetical protein